MDAIVFHKFNYFYKSLFLLLIILICNAFIFILKDISTYNRTYISQNYILVEANEEKNAFYLEFQPQFTGEKTDEMLQNHYTIWVRYTVNCMFADRFYYYYSLYNKYTNLIYYGIYVFGWSYILIML
jgi:hypothetical protein